MRQNREVFEILQRSPYLVLMINGIAALLRLRGYPIPNILDRDLKILTSKHCGFLFFRIE